MSSPLGIAAARPITCDGNVRCRSCASMLMHRAGLKELELMPRAAPVRIMCAECGTVNHWSGRMEAMRHPTVELFALYADTHGTSARVRHHLIQLSERVAVDGPLDRIKAKWAEANEALHALEHELDVLSDAD